MTALVQAGELVAQVYVEWSRWTARCVRCPKTARLLRFASHFLCSFCGATVGVTWPTEAVVAGIERLLMMRPDPLTRNWLPGESLHDLAAENLDHGILPPPPPGVKPGTPLLVLDDYGIRVDNLPAIDHHAPKELTL